MANITRDTKASVDASTAAVAEQISGSLIAAEDLPAAAACHINSDGEVVQSNGTANDADAHVDGFTPTDYKAGEPVTLYGRGVRFHYGSGLTPGANLYLATADGLLSDAATTGGTKPIARVISATDIVVFDKA